jgi:hypothetical protein
MKLKIPLFASRHLTPAVKMPIKKSLHDSCSLYDGSGTDHSVRHASSKHPEFGNTIFPTRVIPTMAAKRIFDCIERRHEHGWKGEVDLYGVHGGR